MRKSEITKQKLLASAEKVFSQKGLYGARIDEIAELAGVNKRMIYEHFGGKDSLYIETLTTVYARLAEMETAVDISMPPVEAVRRVISVYFEFLRENPSFVKLVMWENLNEAAYIDSSGASTLKNAAVDIMKKVLNSGKESGIFKKNINDEEIIFAMNMFSFSYFSNIHTMSRMLEIDLYDKKKNAERSDMVSDIILSLILK